MNVNKDGDFTREEFHRVYRTTSGSSVAAWLRGRRRGNVTSPPASSTKTFTTLDVRLDGSLLKQGSWRKNWKERFFVLRRDAPVLEHASAARTRRVAASFDVTGRAAAAVGDATTRRATRDRPATNRGGAAAA